MPAYIREDGGPRILVDLTSRLANANRELVTVTARDDLPTEHRRRLRNEAIAEAQRLYRDAATAHAGWVQDEIADARKRYHSDPVASAADETRRLRMELQTSRLIEASRLADERQGVTIVDGRPVANGSAFELAARAERAYLDGRYDEAQMLATASTTLGGPRRAAEIHQHSQDALDQEIPTRRQALKDIAEAKQAELSFALQANAALASAFQEAQQAATAIGDDGRIFAKAAIGPSMTAKLAAFAQAREAGTDYVEPSGVMPGEAVGAAVRRTDGELARQMGRVIE